MRAGQVRPGTNRAEQGEVRQRQGRDVLQPRPHGEARPLMNGKR